VAGAGAAPKGPDSTTRSSVIAIRPVSDSEGYARPAIAGSGTIACGLAACASAISKTRLLARSDASAWRAEEEAHGLCAKVDGGDPANVKVTTDPADLGDRDLVVEAIVEEPDLKVEMLSRLAEAAGEADLATTTSSMSVSELGERCGHPERTFGLHPFNPVVRMELIELCVPQGASDSISRRARAWCEAIGKTVVDVPDEPGFVVNRLLFPYLFDAVRLLEQTGMRPQDVDRCMTLGTGHPMGPLALLDLVGIDVAVAIGEVLHADSGEEHHRPPERLHALAAEGKLGRKSGAGFYDYR
jgi:3-hydroxybutyryl-CoA dehydrogenase